MAENCIMTVEEYLGQYLKIEDEIQSEKEYIASLKAIVENTTTHLSFTAGRNPSKDNGKFENTMLDIVEAEMAESRQKFWIWSGEFRTKKQERYCGADILRGCDLKRFPILSA